MSNNLIKSFDELSKVRAGNYTGSSRVVVVGTVYVVCGTSHHMAHVRERERGESAYTHRSSPPNCLVPCFLHIHLHVHLHVRLHVHTTYTFTSTLSRSPYPRLLPPPPICFPSASPKLSTLPNLRDVLFIGNPMYEGMTKEECRLEVLRRIPQVNKHTHTRVYTEVSVGDSP